MTVPSILQGAAFQGTPTRVVLLQNMVSTGITCSTCRNLSSITSVDPKPPTIQVGPGEVDEQLDEEVGQECSKYGVVSSVLIFEVTTPGFPADSAVRIFLQFERVEAATKVRGRILDACAVTLARCT